MKTLIFSILIILFSNICFAQYDTTPELIPYRKSTKWGYCNQSKEIIIPCKYDVATPFSEGLAAVVLNNKYGFIDKEGKDVIPLKYDLISSSFSEGLVSVMLKGKWGFIDKNGTEYWEY